MTRRQVERTADLLDQVALASFVGSIADLVLVGQHLLWSWSGMAIGLGVFGISLRLTAILGGPKI